MSRDIYGVVCGTSSIATAAVTYKIQNYILLLGKIAA